jgi:hypothetical protein
MFSLGMLCSGALKRFVFHPPMRNIVGWWWRRGGAVSMGDLALLELGTPSLESGVEVLHTTRVRPVRAMLVVLSCFNYLKVRHKAIEAWCKMGPDDKASTQTIFFSINSGTVGLIRCTIAILHYWVAILMIYSYALLMEP